MASAGINIEATGREVLEAVMAGGPDETPEDTPEVEVRRSKRRRRVLHQPDGRTDRLRVIAGDHQCSALRLRRARLADQGPFE